MIARAPLRALLVLACAGPLLVAPAAAWGPVGHRAVGAVADELLRPRAQAAIADLLAQDRDRDGRFSGRHTLAEVADWPDEIRGGPGDHPHWHYDNRPICGTGVPPSVWCPGGECASAQLPALLAVLADPRQPRSERNMALKWVVHLAGDLHQPLHAADLAEGGNQIRVAPPPNAHGDSVSEHSNRGRHGRGGESLHAFWDSHLVNLTLHPEDGQIPQRSLQRLLRDARATGAAALAAGPQAWAEESNDIARHFALDIDGVDCSLRTLGREQPGPTVTLSRDYIAHGRRVVEERLALAGARLAHVLNESLDPGGE